MSSNIDQDHVGTQSSYELKPNDVDFADNAVSDSDSHPVSTLIPCLSATLIVEVKGM